MTRVALLAAVALGSLVVAEGALAKGPIEASIDGPGLASSVQVGDWANFGQEDAMASHQPIMQLAEAAGFFPATYGQPSVAEPSPVTYMPPGQTIFELGNGTAGGWYVADDPSLPQLLPLLIEAGLPESAPPAGGGDGTSFPTAAVGAAAPAVLLGLGALGVMLVRRRPHVV